MKSIKYDDNGYPKEVEEHASVKIRKLLDYAKDRYMKPNWGDVCPRCPCAICEVDREAERKQWKRFLNHLHYDTNIAKVGVILGMDLCEFAEMEAWFDYRSRDNYKTFYHEVGGYDVLMKNKAPYYAHTVMMLNRSFWSSNEILQHFLNEEQRYPEGTIVGVCIPKDDFLESADLDRDLVKSFFERYDVVYLV